MFQKTFNVKIQVHTVPEIWRQRLETRFFSCLLFLHFHTGVTFVSTVSYQIMKRENSFLKTFDVRFQVHSVPEV